MVRELDCLRTPISFIRKCFSKAISSKTSSPSSSPFSWKRLAEKLCFFLKKKRDDSKKRNVSFMPEEPVPEKAVVSKAGECLPVGARNVIPRSRVVELEVGEGFRRKDDGLGLEREMEVEESGYCLASRRGARHRMEDGYGIMTNIHGDSKQAFFREFNEHGGKEAMLSTVILSPPPKGEICCSSSGSENHLSISIYDIPTEVFDNILLLMDKNTICRFRCASRWCNDRVSNPTFCLPHYRQQLHRGRPLHQINWMEDGSNIYRNISTIDWTNPLPHHYNIWPFAHPKKNVMVAVSKSSCLGLLCLYGPECTCLYNPTTRSVFLDLPPFKYSHRFTTLAFGLLHSTNQLKVVNLTYCPRSSCHARCKVLTIPRDLGSGWREAPSPPFYTTHKPLTASVESTLYFLITYRLFRFDLETEQWSEVKLPLPIRSLPMISEFKGNLYLIAKAKIHFEVWLMREQDVWVKMWALTHNYSGMLMHPMRHDEELERSLIVNRHDQLRWYNIDDGTHKECVGSRLFNIPYVETWASLKTLCDI